jgi:hypothetical protein
MSNDTNYKITIKGANEQIRAVVNYLEEKSSRWENWKKINNLTNPTKRQKAFKNALNNFGLTKPAEFVSWGFNQEKIEDGPGTSTVFMSGFANENSQNTSISGSEGELAVLYDKFPILDYMVDYEDEISSGVCHPPKFEKEPLLTSELLDILGIITDNGDMLDLYEFKSIDVSAAEVLARYKGGIKLGDLRGLSDSAAQAFGNHKGGLRIGLKNLSDSVAQSLAKHKGEWLIIEGLAGLSDAAAEALAKHKGHLYLSGLTSLSDRAAQALGKHKRGLQIGLKNLSNSVAQSLAKHKGEELIIEGLAGLSDAAAEALAKHKGPSLFLTGLTTLSDAAAETLAQHNGRLNLSGLGSLSLGATKALAEHKGDLCLGLTSLSDAAAEALAKHKGHLYLSGLTSLSDTAAEALAKHEGELSLNGGAKAALTRARKRLKPSI